MDEGRRLVKRAGLLLKLSFRERERSAVGRGMTEEREHEGEVEAISLKSSLVCLEWARCGPACSARERIPLRLARQLLALRSVWCPEAARRPRMLEIEV